MTTRNTTFPLAIYGMERPMNLTTMRKVLQYILPVTLTLFMCVSLERTVVTDGGYDRLCGLPLPYISGNLGCTGCFEVYVLPMIVNLLFFFAVVIGLVRLIEKIKIRIKKRKWLTVLGLTVGVAVSLFWIWCFLLMTQDSRFYLTNQTAYKTTSTRLFVEQW